jgi:PEP-CTERM motif
MKQILGLLAVGLLVGLSPARAASISPVSYDMNNGHGQASGGSFNYWDRSYTGLGATTTDDAPLSGGKGDLTDGIAASDFWYNVENNAGTGPYVGWYSVVRRDPSILFNFADTPTISEVRVHLDNSGAGGVFQPLAFLVNGQSWAFTPLAPGAIGWITLTGAAVTGNALSLTLVHQPFSHWIFGSEVQFDGTPGTSVPEPGTLALLGLGLAGLGLSRRRTA